MALLILTAGNIPSETTKAKNGHYSQLTNEIFLSFPELLQPGIITRQFKIPLTGGKQSNWITDSPRPGNCVLESEPRR